MLLLVSQYVNTREQLKKRFGINLIRMAQKLGKHSFPHHMAHLMLGHFDKFLAAIKDCL